MTEATYIYASAEDLKRSPEELKKYRLVVSDEIKIDVYVSLIKEQRKNGGKLTSEALTQKGRTPSTSIKSKHKKKGKKNGKL